MTYSPEIVLLILNGVILILEYFLIFPRTVGNNISKLMQSDLLATATSVIVAGFLFWGTDHQFDLLVGEVNWFFVFCRDIPPDGGAICSLVFKKVRCRDLATQVWSF